MSRNPSRRSSVNSIFKTNSEAVKNLIPKDVKNFQCDDEDYLDFKVKEY